MTFDEWKMLTLNYITREIGTSEEVENKFICKVEQRNMEIIINSFRGLPNWFIQELEMCGSNKPLYYVFEGFTFKSKRIIFKELASVVFKNCTFINGVYLEGAQEVVFESNMYKDEGISFYPDNEPLCLDKIFSSNDANKRFLTINGIEKLTFRNDDFLNSGLKDIDGDDELDIAIKRKLRGEKVKFGITATDVKEIEFSNTRVEVNSSSTLSADTIRLENSTLVGTEFDITARSIENTDSVIKARDGVVIENPNCDFDGIVETPIVLFNGEDVTNYNSTTTLVNREQILRVSLIDALKQIHDKSREQMIEEMLKTDTRGVGEVLDPKALIRKMK